MLLNAFRRIFRKAQNRKARRSYTCPQLLQLESRIVPANFQVTSLADTATGGTLREAIDLANTTAGNDTIGFAPSLFSSGAGTITLLTAQLPQILNASTIVGAGTRGTLTITGPGASTLTISGNNGVSGRNFHILSIDTGGNLAISGVTFSGAKTTGAGGAIENAGTLTVSGSTITGNSANDGGGITNWGTLTVINTTISGNTSITQAGGGIQNSSGSLTVTNSTISGNTAATQAGGIQNNGILVVTNSTISGNTALTQSGGGIYNFTTGTLTLSGTTIAGNSANDGGGIRNLGALNISNTIIANSTSGGDYAGGGSIGTNSNNLVEDGTLPGTSEITGDPNLGPLQNNGGPTFTMALRTGSVAIGAGNATISNAAPINKLDQRGINRTTSDIGAYSFGIQVTNTSDSNTVGSLRAAINLANTTPGDDQIRFNLTGLNTITLGSALPTIVSASTAVTGGTAGTVTITGLGASSLNISGNNGNTGRDFSIFSIASGGNLSISGVTVSGANTSGNGGAFNNAGTLAVSGSTISGNSAISKGGGFYNQGNLFIADSVITGNSVTGWTGLMYGGGIYNGNTGSLFIANTTISSNSSATHAGGISNLGISTITNSTISNNSTVYSAGGILNNGILKLSNSTIFGNTATKTSGGGIFNNSALDIFNTTIASNSAISGGGINVNGGNLNISNTIIANSTSGGDFSGAQPVTSTNNLITIGTLTGATPVTSAQLNLGPLQNNGGPTFTMALGAGSAAIGAGNATISNAAPINGKDQRGVTRSSTAPSIGAFEYNGTMPSAPTVTLNTTNNLVINATTLTIAGTGFSTTAANNTVTFSSGTGHVTSATSTQLTVTFDTAPSLGSLTAIVTTNSVSSGAAVQVATIFGTATQATLTTPAAGAPSGSAFTTQPVITIKDAAGNTVTNSTASVTMTVSSGATTLGTTTINAVAGIATFTNVGISGIAGTPYTLTFTSTGLTSATQTITPTFSSTFTVSTTANSGLGSLSAAITLANTTPGDDQIVFNLTGLNTITLGSALPTIVTASTVVGSGTAGTVTITGLGASSLIISGNNGDVNRNFSIFSIASSGNLSISGVTVSGAQTSGLGGAFNNSGTLTVNNSNISGNTANLSGGFSFGSGGGGIWNGGDLTVTNSTISGNTTSSRGGGILNYGTTTITNSTISGNTAGSGGAGIFNNSGNLAVTNSTISGNTASTNGGGIFNSGTLNIANSTISGNTASTGAGGGINNGGTLNIANTIIANSTNGGDYAGGGTVTLISPATSASNLVTQTGALVSAWATTVTSAQLNLGPLQNNGGPTSTMALGAGSAAIGAGNATISNAAPINGKDQRGYARSSTAPSIGAFEYIPATQATLTTTAVGAPSGSAFTTQPVITLKDTFGNTVNTNVSVTMTVSSGATTVGTTINTVNAVNGVATFSGVGISGTAGTPYTLTFTSTGLTVATQSIIPIFGTATQTTLTTDAAGAPSGSVFTTQPIITIKDAAGNTVTNSTASVTMTVSSGATTLGMTTINAVAGVATFTNVGISGAAGTPYTLTFTSTGLTIATQSITATFGLATQATLTTQAAGSASGSAFTTQPVITIKDTFGNIVTNSTASVTMTVSSGDNKATTVGAFTINAVAGIATFTNVGISGTDKTSYTLTFASGALTATQNITPTFGLATQATITTPAAGAPSGLAFITQPIITINDTFGNPITNSTASVTMTVSGGASTIGTTTVNAVAGIVTFTNVGIGGAGGTSYSLTFASTGLNSATQSITPIFGPTVQVSSPSEPIPFPLGVSSTKDLAILTGINPATISGYVATIVWGDGSQNSAGTIALSPNQSGVFQVLGTHTYSSLEMFNGSVSVTSVFDNRIFSSSFNVEVLTAAQKEKINDISAEVLPPGGKTADVTISGVINSFYKQSANNSSPVILFTASYVSNPQPYTTTAPAQSFFDVRLRNPDPEAVLTLTANFSGGLQRGSSPYIQFAQDTSTSYQNVVSSNNLVVINYINNTITVLIDQNSFPLINNLRGTVFAVVTGATQVSSNTITVLPAAFTSGTAVGIAWGASSTVVDVATATTASNTTLTFQNSRKTTLSLAPSQSKGTVILRAVNNGGTTKDEASKETIKQLTNPDMLQSIIRGTIGIGPEVIGGMIKKMLPENAGNFLREWSKVISEIKAVSSDMITPKINAIPEINKGSSIDKPEECDDSLLEDAAFDDISKISSTLGLVDESSHCLNGVSLDSMLEELAFSGEINWAGLALSTLALSQFRTFSKDKPKPSHPIKISA